MRIRYQYKEVAGFHVITSPDLPGLHVTGATLQEALHDLDASVSLILEASGRIKGKAVPVATEFNVA